MIPPGDAFSRKSWTPGPREAELLPLDATVDGVSPFTGTKCSEFIFHTVNLLDGSFLFSAEENSETVSSRNSRFHNREVKSDPQTSVG